MGFLDVSRHLIGLQEGVVDIGIQFVALVNVNDRRAIRLGLLRRDVLVVVTL